MKTKIRIQFVSVFGLPFLFFLLLGCWGGSPTALPDAPPPYPDSPFPQGTQTGTYSPPLSPDPYGRDYENRKKSTARDFSKKNLSPKQSRPYDNLYSIEAIGTIWVLIQDKFGNELQWVSLMAGNKIPINHNGPLTITCSSGESLIITDPKGKLFKPAGLKKGITIIRLP